MSDITKELREYGHDCCARIDDAIHEIADRIDAELAERYVELPEDGSDGVWHNGDMAQSKKFPYMRPKRVCGTGVINGKPVLFYATDDGGHCSEEHKGWDYASCMRHYQPDTWERIVDDMRQFERMGKRREFPSGTAFYDRLHSIIDRCEALAKEGA